MSADLETLDSIARALEAFGEAPPALLDARLLQQRVDRKFLLHVNTLERLLDHLIEGHRAVRSGSTLAAGYRTRYFDTPDRRSYHDHRRDRRPRYKVRIRHHLDRGLSFLEIKRKGGDGRTTKARRPYPFECEALDDEALRFIDRYCPFGAASLVHGPLAACCSSSCSRALEVVVPRKPPLADRSDCCSESSRARADATWSACSTAARCTSRSML
jgi:hypothetical protein